MNFKMKTETGTELSFKINNAVALAIISGIGVALKMFM